MLPDAAIARGLSPTLIMDRLEQLIAALEAERDLEHAPPIGQTNARRFVAASAEIMYEQLGHLMDVTQQPDVFIQIVLKNAGYYEGLGGAFMLAKVDGNEVAYEDGIYKGCVLEDPNEVAELSRNWQATHAVALSQADSLDLIAKAAEEWKK